MYLCTCISFNHTLAHGLSDTCSWTNRSSSCGQLMRIYGVKLVVVVNVYLTWIHGLHDFLELYHISTFSSELWAFIFHLFHRSSDAQSYWHCFFIGLIGTASVSVIRLTLGHIPYANLSGQNPLWETQSLPTRWLPISDRFRPLPRGHHQQTFPPDISGCYNDTWRLVNTYEHFPDLVTTYDYISHLTPWGLELESLAIWVLK